jgi:hypothetical protein
MDLVKMKEVGDCGPACLAMVLGKTLEEVVVDFPLRGEQGLTDDDLMRYLAAHGIPALSSMEWPSRVPAILTVPSLNHPGLLHYIFWDGKQILDPSNGEKRYPDDTPQMVINAGCAAPWATAILLWL